jgi:hypothetical protein
MQVTPPRLAGTDGAGLLRSFLWGYSSFFCGFQFLWVGWLEQHRVVAFLYIFNFSVFPQGAENPPKKVGLPKSAAGKPLCLTGFDLLLMATAQSPHGAFSVDGLAVAGEDNMPMAQAKNPAERTADTPRPRDLHQLEWTLKFV